MSCVGKLLNYVTCGCFCGPSTTVVDDDETRETAVLVPAIWAQSELIESLSKQLKEATALREQYKGMKDRSYSQYSSTERGLFNALTAPRPFNFRIPSEAAPSQTSTAVRHRGPSEQVKQHVKVIQEAVVQQKFIRGVKLGNWDGIKEGILGAIIGQLESQGLKDTVLLQVLNALPSDTKKDFADIGIQGLSL